MQKVIDSSQNDVKQQMRMIIQRIATGPKHSKNIDQAAARAGMRAILANQIDPIQAGVFLIALRMKRESDDELKGILDAIQDITDTVTAEVDEVLNIADPYDGYNRCLPASPFLLPLLAECGVPTLSHGSEGIGPKFGVTHHHVFAAAGVPVDLTAYEAAQRLADPKIGWSYIDQSSFCAPLHNLIDLRSIIVKRQALTTVEVLARPILGRRHTHLVTGYVHSIYPRIYSLLARHAEFDSALLIHGSEGGIIPSLRQAAICFNYQHHSEEQSFTINPAELGIEQAVRAVPLPDDLPQMTQAEDEIAIAVDIPATARATVQAGRAALEGMQGPFYDSLVLAGSLILWHLGREPSLTAAAGRIRTVLDHGRAALRMR